MNSKDYTISLQAEISSGKKTEDKINKQIKEMQNKLDSIEIDVTTKGSKQTASEFNTLDEALRKVGLSSQELNKSFTDIQTKTNSAERTVTRYASAAGKTVDVTTRIVDGQKVYSATITKLNTELAKNVNSTSSLNAKYKTYDETLKTIGIDAKTFSSEFTKISSTIDANGNSIERWTNNSGKIVTITGKMVDGQKKFSSSIKEVNNSIDENAKQANKWQAIWSRIFQSFTAYTAISMVFNQIKSTISDMVQEVMNLDKSLTELRKVTDLSGESLRQFTKDAYAASREVAKTGTEMIDATTEFAKAGFDEKQALNLGKVALMYTNIADEEVSAAEAASFMISQMKAFNIEASDSMHIIDAVNEVANRFAVSSADIADNLGRSSAVMANAGNSYEQMIGLITAGTEILRDANKVSNGKKMKPYVYSNMHINIVPNPVIPKAYNNYNIRMKYA